MEIRLQAQTNCIYFLSDFHLGVDGGLPSIDRERLIVKWLDQHAIPGREIFLLGDIFDFWHEWKHVAPRGFTRFLGKIARLTDQGIPVHFFTGNHDVWVYDYLPAETGMKVYRQPVTLHAFGKTLYVAHGDGLGNYDPKFNFLKRIFTNKHLQWWFSRLHPNFAIGLAKRWSRQSRASHGEQVFLGEAKEWLVLHSRDVLATQKTDAFIYGHRHLPLIMPLAPQTHYINLGDWLYHFTYLKMDRQETRLYQYYPTEKEYTDYEQFLPPPHN